MKPPLDGPAVRSDARRARSASPIGPGRAAPVAPPNSSPLLSARREGLLERLEASGRYPTWVLLAALAGMFATAFPITILAVSLASIAAEFSADETTMAWVISAPMLFSAVTFPLLGKLGDQRGHRRVFLLGFAGSTVVAVLTAFAWDPLSLIGFRTLAAILGGATQPTAMALIFSVTPPEQRVRAMGWWSMTTAAAPALGLSAGGPLVDLFGWRILFLLQAGFSVAALLLAMIVLRETRPLRVRFDIGGSIALCLGVGGWMVALGSLRSPASLAAWIPVSIAIGVVGLVAFVAIERRVAAPLLPLRFFRSSNFSSTLVTNAFTSAAYMGAFVVAPILLLDMGYTVTAASYLVLLRTVALTIFSPLGGRAGEIWGERGASLVGCSTMTLGLLVAAWAAHAGHLALFVTGLVLQGAGHGLSQPSITAAIARSVPSHDLGIAGAANRLMGQGGGAFGITLLALAYGGRSDPDAFALAFAVGALLSGLSIATALGMGVEPVETEATAASAD
ncbi:MAG: MFS transporter [Myxococcota bacterium]